MAIATGEVITRVYAITGADQVNSIIERIETTDEPQQWQQRLDEIMSKPLDSLTDTDALEAESLMTFLQAWRNSRLLGD